MQQDDDEIILPQVTPDTGIDAETQMTPEEAVDVYEVGTDTVRTPTGLGPRRTDYVQPTEPFAPTGQTVPLSFTGSGVSMYSPIQFTKQTPYEAITGEAEYKLQPFPFTGAAFYGYRKPAVDPTIAREQALVTVEEAYTKANFPDKARDTLIMAQTGFPVTITWSLCAAVIHNQQSLLRCICFLSKRCVSELACRITLLVIQETCLSHD